MEISSDKWFKLVFGIDEEVWLKKPIIHKNLNVGHFDILSIKKLRELIKNPQTNKQKQFPEFSIFVRDNDKTDDAFFDTSSLQLMNWGNKPAMFQVASNFNCQENASEYCNFRSGRYLTNLMSDHTQGPSACGGAALGSVFRLLKHLEKPINLLSDTPYASDVTNGKLHTPRSEAKLDIDKVCIGLHTNVPAQFNRSRHKCIYYQQGRLIDQVFTSTIINPLPKHHQLAHDLLLAAYTGIYLAAIQRKTEVLVLTLIGGGSFNNPFEMIVNVIAKVHSAFGSKGNLKRVILPLWDKSKSPEVIIEELLRQGLQRESITMTKY